MEIIIYSAILTVGGFIVGGIVGNAAVSILKTVL